MVRRHVPAALVVSTVFLDLAQAEAEAFGYPGLPMLVFPHPLAVRSSKELHQFAEQKVKDLLEKCMRGGI
jgi:hypothetical protein